MTELRDLSLTQLKAIAFEQTEARDVAINNLNVIKPLINEKIQEEQAALAASDGMFAPMKCNTPD